MNYNLFSEFSSGINVVPWQVDSLNTQHDYLKNQLDSLKSAAQPRTEEVNRLKELRKLIAAEEKEIARLVQGSRQLKEKVCVLVAIYIYML